jgi:hypothetical protein
MTVVVEVRTDREAAAAASRRSGTLAEAYAALAPLAGGCPIEAGLIGSLADNECKHDRLSSDRTPPCGCWPSEVVKDPPLVHGLATEGTPDAGAEMAEAKVETPVPTDVPPDVTELVEVVAEVEEAKPATPVPTESASQLVEIPAFVEQLVEQLDAEVDRLRAERAAVLAFREAIT